MELTLIFALISIFSSYFLPSVASEPLIKPVGPCTNSTHSSKKVQDLAESSGKALKGSIKLETLQKSQVVLRGNATITSANKTFRLGFFAPNDEFKWYLGIWYASIPIPTYVWVANREKPIKNLLSASAEITGDGKLAVIDQDSRTLMWETSNVEKASDLRLFEQGNLVLLSSDGRIVWRSFDFPTDTWLPGMNLTAEQRLTSWKSSIDPAPGRFDFIDPFTPMATFGYTEVPLESGIKPPLTRFVLDHMGQLKQFTWSQQSEVWNTFWSQPENVCRVYALCGNLGFCNGKPFNPCECLNGFRPIDSVSWGKEDFSEGCWRQGGETCNEDDKFEEVGTVAKRRTRKQLSGWNDLWHSCDPERGNYKFVVLKEEKDSSAVAVKRLERPGGGEKEFRAEVCTIGNIQHVNLVRLRGFCSENSHRLLVYDYMPNGPLSMYLRHGSQNLSWDVRFRVAVGTARGIAYLHEECRNCIIHCDIKPENILLDEDFSAKVSDFGLAKLIGRDFSRVLATMRGTWGYVAPEWISGVAITTKADVYSYGMTLLELIGGRRNVEGPPSAGGGGKGETEKWFFPPWAARQIIEGNAAAVVDERLGSTYSEVEAARLGLVAVWCIQDDESTRPTMGMVVKMLEGVVEVAVPPPPKLLQALVSGESFQGVGPESGKRVLQEDNSSFDDTVSVSIDSKDSKLSI
ncbi:G-type lectin S-receptor-like serine/threonine-protein kinase SD2-2 [Sesamum angolense]|uniref:non-specific serine/threonine protein kinase n=1 Tax=Sesamum angolense TaxID=2727404 RepID=A0AAE1XHE3_9LAMI|nr:G-type lectin S-receptor-like serine/threonine-protein kinase SD2-2 [Sesamum angolense]